MEPVNTDNNRFTPPSSPKKKPPVSPEKKLGSRGNSPAHSKALDLGKQLQENLHPNQAIKKSPKIARFSGRISPSDEKLKAASEVIKLVYGNKPLIPANTDSDSPHSVYILHQIQKQKSDVPNIVFKPGRVAWVKAKIGYGIAYIFGLENVVAPSISTTVPSLIDKKDVKASYLKLEGLADINGQRKAFLAHKSDAIITSLYDFPEVPFEATIGDEVYLVKPDEENSGLYKLETLEEEATSHTVNETLNDRFLILEYKFEFYLVSKHDVDEIHHDKEGEYVLRNNSPYRLKADAHDKIQVVGHNIKGLAQYCVDPLFVGKGKDGLDIRAPSKERDAFYQSIGTLDFIDAFLATLLLAPQDGKISGLKNESNYLFRSGQHLTPVMIDMDEIFPDNNTTSTDQELMESGNVHPLRIGLMGFPQARLALKNDALAHFRKRVKVILKNAEVADAYLKEFIKSKNSKIFSQAMIAAFNERIARLTAFVDEIKNQGDFTLEDLTFSMFPEYKTGWMTLKQAGLSLEDCALYMGHADPEIIAAEQSGRKVQTPSNPSKKE